MKNLQFNRSCSKENLGDFLCQEIEFFQHPTREHNSVFSKLMSNAILHALEVSLTALLSPIIMLQWLLKHDHFIFILRVIFEVAFELIMLIVFAGVSILIAAALILDDFYNQENYNKDKSNSSNTDENNRKVSPKLNFINDI